MKLYELKDENLLKNLIILIGFNNDEFNYKQQSYFLLNTIYMNIKLYKYHDLKKPYFMSSKGG